MGLEFYFVCIDLFLFSFIWGFLVKEKNIKQKWENFSKVMCWIFWISIIIGAVILLFFLDKFLLALNLNLFIQGAIVLLLLIIGFPFLPLITIGFWTGYFIKKLILKRK